jgi:hypothetical protein
MNSEFIDDPLFRQRYRFGRDGDVLRVEIRTELRWPGPRGSTPLASRGACAHWSRWRRSPTATARP